MSLVSSVYLSDSEGSDIEIDGEPIQNKEEEDRSSLLPNLPDQIIHKFNKPPVLNPLNDRMYKAPMGRNTCYMFLQLRLDSKQNRVLDMILNDVNSVMNMHHMTNFEPLHRGKLGTIKPLHVSLTSSLYFTDGAETATSVAQIKKEITTLKYKSIPISLAGNWRLYDNFDSSLTFLTLNLSKSSVRQLQPILDAIKRNVPPTYHSKVIDPETAHISFGVIPNNKQFKNAEEFEKSSKYLRHILATEALAQLPLLRADLQFRCQEIKAEIGVDVISMPFSKSADRL
ncbi:phosphoric diester hydrolase [Kluyveromyces lactis]|uniref:U6 snRNA phosphodiesterase 1 n=1 Tax=Kluyveromyces lactis (strain ATCC 8585 / CBS 2359 / DSM 70799 / NBRC 1267 / NRRL Y-1140 / WM37) TaxID=284590 RepID=Q6CQK2_KLULA|nr:uncharacterized protein KLLA0_D16478g [Kluyveromyces lactis]CAH00883.1 KLLA0D16478p [Kluyveromyces lactis]|eukprot:XP_453787.1 uncharacterized protein KLLA0_D16478g [Kluyveromyces lactis]